MSRNTRRIILALALLCACRADEAAWQVRPDGVGRIQFGMSIIEAASALGTPPEEPVAQTGCTYWRPTGAPAGLSLMVEEGRVVRADVDSAGIPDPAGVEVGHTDSTAFKAHPVGMTTQPHKYRSNEGWHYLIHSADALHATIFESDGRTIRSYRVGLRPQVEYVERCG